MKHPTEAQLNEYLDNVLEATAQSHISVHLTICADCRGRLASLETVFQALAALPEEKLGRDLTPAVLHALPGSFFGLIGRLALTIQVGVSLGVLLIFAPRVTGHVAGIVQRLADDDYQTGNKLAHTGRSLFPPAHHPAAASA